MATAVERYSAIHPTSHPTLNIVGTDRELEILDLLQRFDVLPSHYVAAWVGKNSATADRLSRLIQGHYIGLLEGKGVACKSCEAIHPYSEDAWDYARVRNVHYPLSIWPRGKALLARRGLWIDRGRSSDEFDHKFFRSLVDWSFAYGARQNTLTYQTLLDIMPSAPWRPTKEDSDCTHIPVQGTSDLIPDSFLKLEGESGFFAHIEIDNNTETQFSKKGAENTIQGKVKRYAQYLERRDFYKRYGLPKITILFFFNKQGRVRTFLDVVKATVAKQDVQQRFAAMYVPDFRESFPPPTGWAVGTYERVGEPLNIMEIVNAKRQSETGLRAGAGDRGKGGRVRTVDGRSTETRPTA